MLVETNYYSDIFNDLKQAIDKDELTVHYQPQIKSSTSEIHGFEALVRWNHPVLGLILPDTFIPFAETSGLIVSLGEWVMKTACCQVKKWQEQFGKPLSIAVNLSIKQFSSSNIVETVSDSLTLSGLNPEYLEVELTEGVTDNIEMIVDTIKQIKDLGVRVSIDDFGKGYSSLYYVKELPVDKIKLDRTFISDYRLARDKTIVLSMISMANNLGLEVVAEGIETEEQRGIFRRHCDYLQGYLFGRPLTLSETESFLKIS